MQIIAQLNNLRITPRKVRLVAGVLRGMDVDRAKFQLDHLTKRSSKSMAKLLESAISNARNSHNLVRENLYIKEIIVNEGPKLKRFRAKGFGMASSIQKKTSHIRIVLDERVPGLKAEVSEHQNLPKKETTRTETSVETEKKYVAKPDKPEPRKEIGKKGIFGNIGGLGKKFFRRKAI